ncbi:hypothetical protein GUJ93_ZPchr0007g3468 [Zizania palustris]|uniref:Uncharacterized protein n=1 Tax=Zizania palustris TaxID=103762 RepID=A0A8J5VSH0_ZIZPA|nr:hypothetical protein GUJ93_ZPchr0007g3468 [Zizania palustris]
MDASTRVLHLILDALDLHRVSNALPHHLMLRPLSLDAPKRVHAVPYIGSPSRVSTVYYEITRMLLQPLSTSMVTARAIRVMASRPSTNPRSLVAAVRRGLLSMSTETGGAGDPSVHSDGPPSDDYADRSPKLSGAEEATRGHGKKSKNRSTAPPSESTKERVPPFAPSGKLGSQQLTDPARGSASWFTPKRRFSSGRHSREEETPGGEESTPRKVGEEDREHYRTHKPSPLAEVEFADTRKPITPVTDAGAADRFADVVPGTMDEDTVDTSLGRAEPMFREAASRGNPEWPRRCWRGAAAKETPRIGAAS